MRSRAIQLSIIGVISSRTGQNAATWKTSFGVFLRTTFIRLGFTDEPAQEPGIVDSIELLKEMLNYTAENIKEEATDYYQKLGSFR